MSLYIKHAISNMSVTHLDKYLSTDAVIDTLKCSITAPVRLEDTLNIMEKKKQA